MKHLIFTLLFFTLCAAYGQTQSSIGNDIFSRLQDNSLLLHEEGILKEQGEIQKYIKSLVQTHKTSYTKDFTMEVNSQLEYEIGEVKIQSTSYSVMFLKQIKDKDNPMIEFLVIYKKGKSKNDSSGIDEARTEWMRLCNAHQAAELVKQVYTQDAYYYNRGRLLQGTEPISVEYGYMNRPTYSLQLTPKHVTFVKEDIAFEIGQCSGSYNLPYMLLWQKQKDGAWQVLMDSNY